MLENILQLTAVVVVFVLVLAGTYYVTKWIAKSGMIQSQSRNIKVIETFKITNGKYIQIIQLGKKYYSIGVTKDQITFLTPLDEAQLDFSEEVRNGQKVSFKELLDKLNKNKKENKKRLVFMKTQKKAHQVSVRVVILLAMLCILTFFCSATIYVHAAPVSSKSDISEASGSSKGEVQDPDSPQDFQFNLTSNAGSSSLSASMKMILVLTLLSLAPFLLVMVTSCTRIIVVLHFVRSALGTQTSPPNQVLIGIALFLTLFIMAPVMTQINKDCIQPYDKGKLTQEEALNAGLKPIRKFMFEQTNRKDIRLFMEIEKQSNDVSIEKEDEIPTLVLIPAFMISELRIAFIIGFLIYLPFIVIDMVVASTLMSMGMMMLPPTTISMPFKILLFVLADGWNLVIGQLVKTFY